MKRPAATALLPAVLLALAAASAGAADSAMSNFVADGVKAWYYNSQVIDNAHGRLFRLSADVTAVGDGTSGGGGAGVVVVRMRTGGNGLVIFIR